ncbi:hypothetical protein [Streptomyces sp. NPDC086766]|uniref:hypothetical protein n=1 Tax=Streptomyces sp. NPDC086766 TaxID=3365754 RepID=UPI003800D210
MYPPTAASLPFLFELAADGATPDRAAVVALLVSIGRESLDRGFEDDGTEIECYPPMGCVQAIAFLYERGAEFAELARDPDPDMRLAAIPGLGLFLDDADRAAAMLRERLAAELGIAARLRIVQAAATVALQDRRFQPVRALKQPPLGRQQLVAAQSLGRDPRPQVLAQDDDLVRGHRQRAAGLEVGVGELVAALPGGVPAERVRWRGGGALPGAGRRRGCWGTASA